MTVETATRAPNSSSFMACVDRGLWRKRPQSFSWSLHPDLKLLEVCSRNSAGMEGVIGTATLEI